ncbi:MAG: hypothetical protein ACI8XB_002882 [Patiriisocius sp.]|jgi:hypothetical protein
MISNWLQRLALHNGAVPDQNLSFEVKNSFDQLE